MKKNVAIFGAGMMGSNHARIVSNSLHSNLKYVIEPNREIGERVASRYSSTWLPELIDFSGIDYVIIATPTEIHHEVAIEALNSSVPVLLEKPISHRFETTLEILNFAERLEVPLSCGFVERFNPAIITLSKILGDVISLHSIRHSPMTPRVKTSVTSDLLIHDIDLAIRLFGEVPSVCGSQSFGFGSKSDSDLHSVDTLVSFANNRYANLSASRISHRKIREISIIEPDRLIEVDLLRRDITIYRNVDEATSIGGMSYKQQTVIEIPSLITHIEPLAAQLDNFEALITNGNFDDIKAEIIGIHSAHKLLADIESSL